MKKRILSFVLLLLFFVPVCQIVADNTTPSSPIDLRGIVPHSTGPSRAPSLYPNVIAEQYESYIDVNFYHDFGAVLITIYDEAGDIVYQNQINTDYGVKDIIDTTSFDVGRYTIVLTNSVGMNLSGNFIILNML